MLEHEVQAAIFEMGDAVHGSADAVTHVEVSEFVTPETPMTETEWDEPPLAMWWMLPSPVMRHKRGKGG